MKRLRSMGLGVLVGLAMLAVGALLAWSRLRPELARGGHLGPIARAQYEHWARERFMARHPGERPLNWRIAEAADRFHAERPMGRFVLHENDCSDFVGCVIDEALGPGARFTRDGGQHVLCGPGGSLPGWLFEVQTLPEMGAAQPGDVVHVRHSPHYAPHDDSISHVGVMGADGRVVDFTKLKSWPEARYGRHEFAWFIRYCAPEEVWIGRLRPEFRYLVIEIRG